MRRAPGSRAKVSIACCIDRFFNNNERDERAPTPPGAKKAASARSAAARDERKYARTVRVAKVTFRGYVWDTVFFSRDATRTSSVRRNDTPCGTHFCYRTRRVFSFFSHSKSWKAFRDALRGTRVDSRVSYGVSRTSRRRRAPRASRRPRPRFVSV